MSEKVKGFVAEQLVEEVALWDTTGDLTTYAEALGSMFEPLSLWAEDSEDYVGWEALFNVELMPGYGLPWLGQIVGERIEADVAEEAAREQIKKTPNQYRGTIASIVAKVKAQLTGAKHVWIRERYNGEAENENWLTVATAIGETPSETAVKNALRQTVPADISLYYVVLSGATWATIETTSPTWTEVEATNKTWDTIEAVLPPGELF